MKNVKCSGSINGWCEDIYQVDKENHTSKKYAIWRNQQWCVAGILSVRNAIKILKTEFTNVEIID